MRERAVLAWAAAAVTAFGAPAAAQNDEYRLDPDGGWVRVDREPATESERVIAEARALLATDRPYDARQVLTRWIKENETGDDPYLATAYRLRGDAWVAGGNEYKALYDYEVVIKQFAATPEYVTAVEREVAIAKAYLYGQRRKVLGLRIAPAERVGLEFMALAAERLPGTALAEEALLEMGEYYFRERDLVAAEEAFATVLSIFPRSPRAGRALQGRIDTNMASFRGPRYDGSKLIEARELIERVQGFAPAGTEPAGLNEARLARIDESLAAQMLQSAEWYIRRGDMVSARVTLRRLLLKENRRYAGTVSAQRAREIMQTHGWAESSTRVPSHVGGPGDRR